MCVCCVCVCVLCVCVVAKWLLELHSLEEKQDWRTRRGEMEAEHDNDSVLGMQW